MIARRVVPIAVFAVLAPLTPLQAQDSTAAEGRNLLGVGVNLPGGGLLAPSFQLGREWRAPASRFAARLTLDYNATDVRSLVYPAGQSHVNTRDATLGFAATFALAKGRIQPYLLSGGLIGYRYVRAQYDADPNAPTVGGRPNLSSASRSEGASLGVQTGAGVNVRVRGSSVFAEYRLFQPFGGGSGYNRDPLPRPFTVGFRF